MVPVFKGGDPTEFSDYRPVSGLPVLSQLFERVLKVRLVEFLESHGVITPGQYGFRSGHSTSMAILDMVEKVRAAWGRGNVSLGVFILTSRRCLTQWTTRCSWLSWSIME